jgi:methionyl-tRNA synthetase
MSYYLTTAISYTNGDPHIGHLYEFIIADTIARYQRIFGKNVWFLTGTDEHGQKIEECAKDKKLQPKELCDLIADKFKTLDDTLAISYNRFIRTTDTDHILSVESIYNKCCKKKDIYFGEYRGWYSVREECLIPDSVATRNNFKDPVTNKPLTFIHEPSYFFRLSKYQSEIIKFLEGNTIFPLNKKQEILNRVNKGLQDISISRLNIKWGIHLPDHPSHVFYVWFDALTNYITGSNNKLKSYWPVDVHIIGKDILWFHSVIWIGMLCSLELELPKSIFAHDFVCDSHGKKMSKSVGNVVDPYDLIDKYPVDAIRYYCIRYGEYNFDFNFSEAKLKEAHDCELLEKFGNLANRILKMLKNKNVINCTTVSVSLFDIDKVVGDIKNYLKEFKLAAIVNIIIGILGTINQYFNKEKPWRCSDDERGVILKSALEGLIVVTHLLYPIIPVSAMRLLKWLDYGESVDIRMLEWNKIYRPNICFDSVDILFEWLDKEAYQRRLKKNKNK